MRHDSKAPIVLAQLKKGSATARQIGEAIGMAVCNVNKHLKRWKFERLVYISAWSREQDSPKYAAVWTLGYGVDATKPVFTESMRKKRWHDNQKRRRERLRRENEEEAGESAARPIVPQNPFSALFM